VRAADPQPADRLHRVTDWWQGCTVYEVYLPSFADSARDGRWDGLGDLPGVRAHLDHLVDLGVDVVWLTPFYPSPLADHGYDVSDYTEVDPRFGTLADLDALIADAHARGLKILGDLVVNHTSSEHPWFVAARSSVDDPHRSFYVWRDGRGSTGELPPNNWVSHFGGPAWTRDEASGQWWLHLFLPEQPDLDWSEPAVADAVDDVLRFWLARGLDGFRIDVAHGMAKHADLPDNPILSAPRSAGSSVPEWSAQEHRYDLDQPAVLDVFRRGRRSARGAVVRAGRGRRLGPRGDRDLGPGGGAPRTPRRLAAVLARRLPGSDALRRGHPRPVPRARALGSARRAARRAGRLPGRGAGADRRRRPP